MQGATSYQATIEGSLAYFDQLSILPHAYNRVDVLSAPPRQWNPAVARLSMRIFKQPEYASQSSAHHTCTFISLGTTCGMFEYLYNKALATFIRSVASVRCETHQDEVLQIPSRDPERSIKVHVYKPTKPPTPEVPTPVLINFHGSGYIIPLHGSDDEFALKIRSGLPYTVLDVKYRLAPEDPFPAASNDAEDVINYVLANSAKYDLSHLSISGFSAGGALALGAAGYTFPASTFRHLIAFYPPTDLSINPSEKHAPDPTGRPLPNWIAVAFNNMYAPPPVDREHPLISPAKIDPSRFPKNVLIITCGFDNLAPETEGLAERMREVPGVNLKHQRVERVGHAWDKEYKSGTYEEKAKDTAYDLAVEMLSV